MVHTRYGIGQLRAAEVRRGCIFAESLDSVDGVLKNGGVIGSGAKFVSPTEGFRFSGAAGARISYGDVLRNPMTAITMMAWFKCDNSVATRMTILGQDYGSTHALYIPTGGAGSVRIELLIGGVSRSLTTTGGGYNDGQWHFAVGTWVSGGPVRIYIDGVLNNSSSNYSGITYPSASDVNLNIGASYNSGSTAFKFKGSIRDCMVFNTALDADEIAAYFSGTMFSYQKYCVCDLPFDIAHHDTVNRRSLDVSGYNNHATWGDGSTSTTFPTKLAGRGYSFDGGDYMLTPITPKATQSIYVIHYRSAMTPTSNALFGSRSAGSVAPWSHFVDTSAGVIDSFRWYTKGSPVQTIAYPGMVRHSFVCRVKPTESRILTDGQTELSVVAATSVENAFPFAVGASNLAGVIDSKIVGNILAFKVFDNIFLNQMQSMDLDIRAKECLSKC